MVLVMKPPIVTSIPASQVLEEAVAAITVIHTASPGVTASELATTKTGSPSAMPMQLEDRPPRPQPLNQPTAWDISELVFDERYSQPWPIRPVPPIPIGKFVDEKDTGRPYGRYWVPGSARKPGALSNQVRASS